MSIPEDEVPIWELRRGSELIARLEITDQDFPWNYGRIVPGVGFEALRELFSVHSDRERAKGIREQLRRQQVHLSPQHGSPVREFTLIVEGTQARFQFV